MRTTVDERITAEDLAEVLLDTDATLMEVVKKLRDKGIRITHKQWGFHLEPVPEMTAALLDVVRPI